MKPVLFVTGHAPPDRVGAFAQLHERENVEFALFGGRSLHGPDGSADGSPPGAEHEPPPRSAPDPSGAGGSIGPGSSDALCTAGELPFPHRHIRQHDAARLAGGGGYRAVVCSTGGRVALPATWAGARRAGAPLILWASLWAHPRSAAHLLSYPVVRRLYRSADAVVTYGPHVSAYVRAKGARSVFVAPQSVDNAFWSAPNTGPPPANPRWPSAAAVKFVFAGRPDREKGIGALIEAWRESGLAAPAAALVLVGTGSSPPWIPAGGAADLGRISVGTCGWGVLEPSGTRTQGRRLGGAKSSPRTPPREGCRAHPGVRAHRDTPLAAVSFIPPVSAQQLRAMYADADVLVVPSIRTRTFREPWGLVANEAMNRGLAVIASDEVGAVAGGLVRDGRNGLVVPAGDTHALALAMVRLAGDPELRARLGAAGAEDVSTYTHAAWADGFSEALASVGVSRAHC